MSKEVSLSEIGTSLGMSKNTVERYLDLLEKAFVVQRLNGFSRNIRNEITKNCRYGNDNPYHWAAFVFPGESE